MIGRLIASALRGYIWATPAHPGRGILGKLAWSLDPRDIIHDYAPGVKLRLTTANSEHITYWTNDYEEHGEMQVFADLLQPGMTVFDIGANLGIYSIACARKVGATGRVFSFEPMPHLYKHLVDTIALNECGDIVTPSSLALSDKVGTARFHIGKWDSLGSLVRPTAGGETLEVHTTTADQFVRDRGINRVDAVKIDVEGAEPFVLEGMHELLTRLDKPMLFVEFNYVALAAAGSTPESLFAKLLAYGYEPRAIKDGQLIPVTGLIAPSLRFLEPTMNYIFIPPACQPPH